MKTLRQFNFTIVNTLAIMIKAESLESAIDIFKTVLGDSLFTQVKYVEVI